MKTQWSQKINKFKKIKKKNLNANHDLLRIVLLAMLKLRVPKDSDKI